MRKNYAFFGGASALYALFYTFCLYRNASGITWPFFAAGTLVYFYSCTRRSGVPWKKDSIFYLVSILLLGVSIFLTDNVAIHNVTKLGIFLLAVSMMLHQYLNDRKWNLSKYLLSLGQALLEPVRYGPGIAALAALADDSALVLAGGITWLALFVQQVSSKNAGSGSI